ncbi:MAG: hypothetical protein OXJ37_02955 [Bryobacterales bacterium]|nr:hypothetical protein [Bryobacterales bacterium]
MDQFATGLGDALSDDLASQDGKKDLGLVEPARARGRADQMQAFLLLHPTPDILAAMRRSIVENHVQILIGIVLQEPT